MDDLRKNVELLDGELLHDRSYMVGLPSVFSRAWLALCLAERGEFAEGLALGEEALRIAEAGDPGYSLVVACAGLGNVCVLKGEFDRAVAVLERGLPREPDEPSAPRVAVRRVRAGRGVHARSGASARRCRCSSRRSSGRRP